MIILLTMAIIIGFYESYSSIYAVRNGFSPGVPESKNLIDFTFLNK